MVLKVSDFIIFLLTLFQRVSMSKQGKIVLGLISLLPIALIIVYGIFFITIFTSVFRENVHQTGQPAFLMESMNYMGYLQVTMALLVICAVGLLIFYLIHALYNTRLDNADRLVWILAFLLINVIAYPLYWWRQVWRAPQTPTYQS